MRTGRPARRTRSSYETERKGPSPVETDLDRTKAWAKANQPEIYRAYEADRTYAESAGGRQSADRGLVQHWKKSTHYDSQRPARDAAMAANEVPAEVRNSRTVADLLNGQDPKHAAAAGSKTVPRRAPRTTRPERERSR